ncbi:MAG: esterase family protein [Planctomycetes bacterium]|nr:esterase family protein [Planctomycetota bacterium]
MHRDYVVWDSPRLGRKMELLWFGHAGLPVLAFPTSVGRFYQNEDFGLIGAMADRVDAGAVQFVCVDSVDAESWYNSGVHPKHRAERHAQYDAYLRYEVMPLIWNRSGRGDVVTFGASFGAYHAMNFACRYPDVVRGAIAFSGLYDVHRFLDGYWDDTCYFHCPTAYVPNMNEEASRRLATQKFVIATGEHDSLVQANRDFIATLAGKGIPVHGEIWPGVFGHDWPFWKEHLRRFLP